jgi:hypothetical protein
LGDGTWKAGGVWVKIVSAVFSLRKVEMKCTENNAWRHFVGTAAGKRIESERVTAPTIPVLCLVDLGWCGRINVDMYLSDA